MIIFLELCMLGFSILFLIGHWVYLIFFLVRTLKNKKIFHLFLISIPIQIQLNDFPNIFFAIT